MCLKYKTTEQFTYICLGAKVLRFSSFLFSVCFFTEIKVVLKAETTKYIDEDNVKYTNIRKKTKTKQKEKRKS